jgi:catechol 2,3-dioxygenase
MMTIHPGSDISAMTSIHPATKIGCVSLTVADLEKQVAFYQQALGFHLHWLEGGSAGLGAGDGDLLRLVEQPDARKYRAVTGLYHFAVLLPDRRELARAIVRLFALKIPNYPTDHIMTKTTYLDDPEGNGIELYAESPEDGWMGMENGAFIARRADGTLSDGREPLDVEALFSHLRDDDNLGEPAPKETRIGHVHLHVRDIEEAVDFYHGLIGFDLMGKAKAMRAAFVSAGGYHHHVGLNTWQGEGAPPPPADAAGLRYFTVVLPEAAELEKILVRFERAGISTEQMDEGVLVRDPSQNGVLFVVRSSCLLKISTLP